MRIYICDNPAKWHPTLHRIADHHNPPISWTTNAGASSKRYKLCGICHYEIHALLNLYVHADGKPVWVELRTFSPFIRRLAEEAWAERIPGKTPFTTTEGVLDAA